MMSEFDDAFKRNYLETMYGANVDVPVGQDRSLEPNVLEKALGVSVAREPAKDLKPRTKEERDEMNRLISADMGLSGRAVADTAAGVAKGVVSGTVGLPGDLAAIARGIYEMGAQGADMGVLDAFLFGLDEGLIAPTTEDVSKFLADKLGPIVPDDVEIESVRQFRERNAERGELAGEILAPGAVLTGAAKAGAKVLGAAKRGVKQGAK